MGEQHGTTRDDPALSTHPQAQRTYLLRGMVRCRPCRRRMTGPPVPPPGTTTAGRTWTTPTTAAPTTPPTPPTALRPPITPRRPVCGKTSCESTPGSSSPPGCSVPTEPPCCVSNCQPAPPKTPPHRQKETDRLRKRLPKIDAAEDAHVREVQALAELDPNSPAVKAMRERHLRAFTGLETERDQIHGKLVALAHQADDHGGDPVLLDALPLLGDALPRLPDRIKQQWFEAFDLAMLYHKQDNQVTCRATITPGTPALTAIIAAAGVDDVAAYLHDHTTTGDLSRHPGRARLP